MGYTHYWTFKHTKGSAVRNETKYQQAIKQCNAIISYYSAKFGGLAGYSAHTKGQYGGIDVNGSRENGHENFLLREHFSENEAFNFCKTAAKPYDVVVTACLIILANKLGTAISVSSDGNSQDWIAGLQLAQNVTRLKSLQLPAGIRHHKLFVVS